MQLQIIYFKVCLQFVTLCGIIYEIGEKYVQTLGHCT